MPRGNNTHTKTFSVKYFYCLEDRSAICIHLLLNAAIFISFF